MVKPYFLPTFSMAIMAKLEPGIACKPISDKAFPISPDCCFKNFISPGFTFFPLINLSKILDASFVSLASLVKTILNVFIFTQMFMETDVIFFFIFRLNIF